MWHSCGYNALVQGPIRISTRCSLAIVVTHVALLDPIATQELLVRNTGVREISYSGERQATRTWQEFQENKSRKSRPQPQLDLL